MALLATSDSPVGVDLEWMNPAIDWRAIAIEMFSPTECAAVTGVEDFYTVWTLKEAYVKALGCGLSMSTRDFTVWPAPLLPDGWSIAVASVPSSYQAALCWR
jgi:4'-phosphopantetheinyl transferase